MGKRHILFRALRQNVVSPFCKAQYFCTLTQNPIKFVGLNRRKSRLPDRNSRLFALPNHELSAWMEALISEAEEWMNPSRITIRLMGTSANVFTRSKAPPSSTLSDIRLFPRFCKMFSESCTVIMQLPCCPGKQGELSENGLQNLRNDLMTESVPAVCFKWSMDSILISGRTADPP